MGVDSYLEIFTTMYGWTFSSVIVRMMADTGLLKLPFLFMIIKGVLDAHEMGVEGGGITWFIRRMEVMLGCGLFVYMSCVASCSLTSLSRIGLHYTPPAT